MNLLLIISQMKKCATRVTRTAALTDGTSILQKVKSEDNCPGQQILKVMKKVSVYFYLHFLFTLNVLKIHQRRIECFLFTRIYVGWGVGSVFEYVTSWPNEKRFSPQICETYSRGLYIKMFFFEKTDPEGRWLWKAAMSRKFQTHLLDCLVFKIHVGRPAGRGYSYFHLYMCLFMYVCHAYGQAKNDTYL